MKSRHVRSDKRGRLYNVSVNTMIERVRKARALSCNPSDVGMDTYVDWMFKYGRAYFLIGKGF